MADKKNVKKQNINQYTEIKSNIPPNPEEISKSDTTFLNEQILQLESKIAAQAIEITDWKNKLLRSTADLQNFQKQTEIDQNQTKKATKKATIKNILPFLNTLNISFSYTPKTEDKNVQTFIDTLRNSFNKLMLDLNTSDIEILTAQTGDLYDVNFMEILNYDFSPVNDTIIVKQVVSVGLRVDSQLIQPISVIVG
jgi:molecular chaperone GrpE